MQGILGGLESYLCPPWGILIYPGSILGLSCDGLRVILSTLEPSWDILGRSWDILGLCWEGLRVTWDHLGTILGHPEAILELSSECWWATWVQGHLAEMPKSLSLGPCAAKMHACNTQVHTSNTWEIESLILHGFMGVSEHLHLSQEKRELDFY